MVIPEQNWVVMIPIENGPTLINWETLSFIVLKSAYKKINQEYKCSWIFILIQESSVHFSMETHSSITNSQPEDTHGWCAKMTRDSLSNNVDSANVISTLPDMFYSNLYKFLWFIRWRARFMDTRKMIIGLYNTFLMITGRWEKLW